jgi:hypothetical protein
MTSAASLLFLRIQQKSYFVELEKVRLTPELTDRPRATFNLHQQKHHEKIAIGRLG